MRIRRLSLLAVLLTCVLGVQGAWAETKGYIDYQMNPTTGWGVLGAMYTGTSSTFAGTPAAVYGVATEWIENPTYGGSFATNSTSGKGVVGRAWASSGHTYGGDFESKSGGGIAVFGLASATRGGLGGYFVSQGGTAVWGSALAKSGETCGGYFDNWSTSGIGVAGEARNSAATSAIGGRFLSLCPTGYGVYGLASATGGFPSEKL